MKDIQKEDQEAKSYIGAPKENHTKFLPLLIERFDLKSIHPDSKVKFLYGDVCDLVIQG